MGFPDLRNRQTSARAVLNQSLVSKSSLLIVRISLLLSSQRNFKSMTLDLATLPPCLIGIRKSKSTHFESRQILKLPHSFTVYKSRWCEICSIFSIRDKATLWSDKSRSTCESLTVWMGIFIFQELADSLTGGPGKLLPIRCDISKEDDILCAFAEVKKKLGGVDVLVNNAGVMYESLLSGTNVSEDHTSSIYKVLKIVYNQ